MRLIPLFLLLVLASCAANSGWVNPAVPKERWSHDYAACRHEADASLGPADYIDPDDNSSLPSRMMQRDDVKRRFDSYVAACMQAQGYHLGK